MHQALLVRVKGWSAVLLRHTRLACPHRCVPGNEAADAAAKRALTSDDFTTRRYDDVARRTFEEYMGELSISAQHVHDQRAHCTRLDTNQDTDWLLLGVKRGDG